jgi:hydroxymethylpyrimidine kinase / phosphomethylpyrimidine kinase / thiamine-phosphate diphosphorylase
LSPKIALSVAGSDSGAGAGIQSDLKTFSALGVYGCTAVTAITAQNTQEVSSIFKISPEIIKKQIQSIMTDIPPDSIKIGMVYSKQVIRIIYQLLEGYKTPIVVDPILAAGSGAKLLLDNAFESFISELIPISTLITPNLMEAEKLTGIKIKSKSNAIEAAKIIKKFGAKNVIIKGGHFSEKSVTDILLTSDGRSIEISNSRINVKETHGSGCNFSSAATAFLARGFSLNAASKLANQYVHNALKNRSRVGKGLVVTNPLSKIYNDASRYNILLELQHVIDEIHTLNNFGRLIPETQSNIVFALPDAKDISDVAGVKGRIIKFGNMARSASIVEFGASKHVASAVLAYMTIDCIIKSALNIKYDEKLLYVCRSLFEISNYDRSKEPKNIKKNEGMTIIWGIKNALVKNPKAEVIYHNGDVGKEPMIIIFGRDPNEVIKKIKKILKNY